MATMECSICLLPDVMLLSDEEHVILYAGNSIVFISNTSFVGPTSFRLLHFFSTNHWADFGCWDQIFVFPNRCCR
jgi:hypothetical protein